MPERGWPVTSTPVWSRATRTDAPPKLLLTPREAAAALGICERSLWSLARAGKVPVVRLGRSTRYHVADLSRLIEASKEGGAE